MKTVLAYRGSICVRPIGRGIVLEDSPTEVYLSDVIAEALTGSTFGDGTFDVEINIRLVKKPVRSEQKADGS